MEEFEMSAKARKAFNELQKLGCPVKEWYSDERGEFWIDAEESGAEKWLDYWSMKLCAGSDRLNDILRKHDMWWEWQNSAYAHVRFL